MVGSAGRKANRGVSRRAALLAAGAGALLSGLPKRSAASSDPWAQASSIAARLSRPQAFLPRDFPVSTHDGDCRQAFADAVESCHQAGGGRVVVPSGDWFCAGPILLKSGVNFHLSRNCRIRFSADPADYARHGDHECGANGKLVLSRWQGNDCLNFSPMIYAFGQTGIGLTGEDWTSVLDGQAQPWWEWKKQGGPADEAALPALSEQGTPADQRIFGLGHFLRPCMIEFHSCTDVLMENYQVTNTPFWQHHPIACRNVVIRGVYANSLGPNNDGFDPESCDGVLCENVTFNSGDDCIAIKSGKNRDVGYGPAANHVIRYCVMNSGHGGVTLGSEGAAGIRGIFVHDLVMRNENWQTNPLNIAIRIKTNMNRGGVIENVHVSDVALPNGVALTPKFYRPMPDGLMAGRSVSTNQGGVVTIDCDYQPDKDPLRARPPQVRDISIARIRVGLPPGAEAGCYQAFILLGPVASDFNGEGRPAIAPITGVTISDCDFGTPSNRADPWFVYNVRDLTLRAVTIDGQRCDRVLSA
jgi:polygalacturonase